MQQSQPVKWNVVPSMAVMQPTVTPKSSGGGGANVNLKDFDPFA